MIVFEYLYGMMGDVFGPKMDEFATGENRLVDNEDDEEVRVIYTVQETRSL